MEHTLHGDFSVSGTLTLTNIPRKSTIAASNVDIGGRTTINIFRASNNFTHTITYTFGSLSGTIVTKTTETAVPFDIPTTFYAQIPNSPTGKVTLTCTTYSGTSNLGSSTTTFTVTANENECRPTVSATLIDVNTTTTALTGSNAKLIKYKSTARITPKATAKNSATIANISIKASGVYHTVTGSYIDFANVVSETFEVIATDTRGYTNTQYVLAPTIIQYIQLSVSAIFERLSPTSNQVKVSYNGNFFNGNFGTSKNALSISWKWKLKGASNWQTGGSLTPTISNNTFTGNLTLNTTQSFNYQNDYEFILYVSDVLSENSVQNPVSKGIPYYDYGEDKDGNTYFWVNGNLYANGKQVKPVIQACYVNAKTEDTYPQASYIPFTTKRYDNSNGKIVFNNNGTITINHTGYIKVSFNVWIWGGSDARPWVQFKNYTDNIIYIDAIDDTSGGYNNFSVSDCIIPVTSGKQFGLYVSANTNFGVNNGSGRENSYMTIELL